MSPDPMTPIGLSPWAVVAAAPRRPVNVYRDKGGPGCVSTPSPDHDPNHQEEAKTSMNDSTSATASVLSTPCSKTGCSGGEGAHVGPQEPLHSTEHTTADDGSWSVQSHSVGSGEWRTHTEAPEDQTPDETEALVAAMLDESIKVRVLNEAIRGETTRQPFPLPRNRVSAQLSTSSVNILSCREPMDTDIITTLMQTEHDVLSLLPSETRLLVTVLLRNVKEVEDRTAMSKLSGDQPRLGWS
jgi:hypothetical protein